MLPLPTPKTRLKARALRSVFITVSVKLGQYDLPIQRMEGWGGGGETPLSKQQWKKKGLKYLARRGFERRGMFNERFIYLDTI